MAHFLPQEECVLTGRTPHLRTMLFRAECFSASPATDVTNSLFVCARVPVEGFRLRSLLVCNNDRYVLYIQGVFVAPTIAVPKGVVVDLDILGPVNGKDLPIDRTIGCDRLRNTLIRFEP